MQNSNKIHKLIERETMKPTRKSNNKGLAVNAPLQSVHPYADSVCYRTERTLNPN